MAEQQWFIESRGARLLSVAGENYYKDELKQTLGGAEETEFTAELRRERANPHDANAIAVYRVGGGMVGHLWRDAAERWAPVIDAIDSRHGAAVSCRAVAGRHIDGGKAGVLLHISLQDLRRELQRRDALLPSPLERPETTTIRLTDEGGGEPQPVADEAPPRSWANSVAGGAAAVLVVAALLFFVRYSLSGRRDDATVTVSRPAGSSGAPITAPAAAARVHVVEELRTAVPAAGPAANDGRKWNPDDPSIPARLRNTLVFRRGAYDEYYHTAECPDLYVNAFGTRRRVAGAISLAEAQHNMLKPHEVCAAPPY